MGTESVDFCREIETYLCKKNDGHLIRVVGPSFELVSGWAERGVPLKGLTYQKVEQALGGTVRQRITLQQGIPQEKAKEIVKFIKETKLKVQASIQGDFVRVAGKDRDTLQEVIAALRNQDFGIDMQFTNYRTN